MVSQRYHAMKDDRAGTVSVIACRLSSEAAAAEASRCQDSHRGTPVITWVEPAPPGCGHQ